MEKLSFKLDLSAFNRKSFMWLIIALGLLTGVGAYFNFSALLFELELPELTNADFYYYYGDDWFDNKLFGSLCSILLLIPYFGLVMRIIGSIGDKNLIYWFLAAFFVDLIGEGLVLINIKGTASVAENFGVILGVIAGIFMIMVCVRCIRKGDKYVKGFGLWLLIGSIVGVTSGIVFGAMAYYSDSIIFVYVATLLMVAANVAPACYFLRNIEQIAGDNGEGEAIADESATETIKVTAPIDADTTEEKKPSWWDKNKWAIIGFLIIVIIRIIIKVID